MVGQQHEYPSPMTHLLVRRSLRLLQQQLDANPTTASNVADPSTTNTSASTVHRLSLAAIVLIPLLIGIILLICYILYCVRYRQYNDPQRKRQQYQLKDSSNATTTLDHHSDGENGSDSTEADDSLNNDLNHQILQSVEVDTDELVVMEEHRPAVEVAPSVTSSTATTTTTASIVPQPSSRDGMLLRRPSYSQTLEDTLLQYSVADTSTDVGGINPSPYHPSHNDTDDEDDDVATTTTNGPIDIDDGTSYDGLNDEDDEDEGVTTAIIRSDAHSPIDEILIFSDMEHSSDDNDGEDSNGDDDEASLAQRSTDLEPYGRLYKSSGPTGTRWPPTATATSHGATTSLLSLLSFEHVPYHPPSTKTTNEKGPKDNNIPPTTNRPVLRRNASVSSNASSSSSLYENIEEQAWIEFQQQSFDHGDTQIFPYQPHSTPSSSLSIPPGNNLLVLQPGDRIRTEDDEDIDEYYSKRMDNVRSLDCKNIRSSNHHSSLLVTQYDDLLRQRQLWDRIQHLPLSSSQPLSSKKPLSPLPTSVTSHTGSSHMARQKVEL